MYYFASDTHLGLRVGRTADDRERLFVRWLDEVSADAEGIFLVGDIFDFWYEVQAGRSARIHAPAGANCRD